MKRMNGRQSPRQKSEDVNQAGHVCVRLDLMSCDEQPTDKYILVPTWCLVSRYRIDTDYRFT